VSSSEINELIAAFRSGRMGLDELADLFRQRKWIRARRPEPASIADDLEQIDPALPVLGSIDEVTAAFDRGELTRQQYRTLARAVAEAINAQSAPAPRSKGSAP
jgi:hypothetical protein